jgi:hypothetical protein
MNRGQEAIEFVLIGTLILFVAIFSFMIFGEKLANFFQHDSAAVKIAGVKAPVYNSDKKNQYTPDYETKAKDTYKNPYVTETPVSNEGTMQISDANIIEALDATLPDDMQHSIQTTGSAGTSDQISTAMDYMSAYLESIAAENPDDTTLKNIADISKNVAQTGHYVADTQEWIELAAQRLDSKKPIKIPENNMICESGYLRTEKRGCDDVISSKHFISGNYSTLKRNLDKWTKTLNDYNEQLLKLSSTKPETQEVTQSINKLVKEIDEISNNLATVAKKAKIKSLQELKEQAASKATDLKSEMIGDKSAILEMIRKKREAQQAAETNSTVETVPVDNSSTTSEAADNSKI